MRPIHQRRVTSLGTVFLPPTVVPHLTTLIRSSEIAVERKRRKAKFKSPLKCIEQFSMHFNRLFYFALRHFRSTAISLERINVVK